MVVTGVGFSFAIDRAFLVVISPHLFLPLIYYGNFVVTEI